MNDLELAILISAQDRASKAVQQVQGAVNGLANTGKKVAEWGSQLNAQGQLMLGTAQRIGEGLKTIVSPALEVDDALAKVATAIEPLNSLEEAIANVRKAGIEWSEEHREGATKFIDTAALMASAGLKETAAIEGTRVAMLTATATLGDSVEAANLLATLYNNIGDKTADVRTEMFRLGDQVTKTQALFQFKNFTALTDGLTYATPIMLQFRMGLSETLAIIGGLNNAGVAGSMAGTSFAATMRQMQKASKDLKFEISRTADGAFNFIGTLRNIEAKYGTLEKMSPEVIQAFQDAFGADGWAGLSLMIGKSAELEKNMQDIANSAGAAAEGAAKIESAGSGPLAILNNNFTSLKLTLAQELAPTIAEVTPKVIGFIREVGNFAKAHPTLIKTTLLFLGVVAAVLAIVAPIMMTVGALGMFAGHAMTVFSKIGSILLWVGRVALPVLWQLTVATLRFFIMLLANPITWIAIAIIAAVYLIYRYWEPISAFFSRVWESIRAGFVFAWNAALGFFAKVMGEIKGAFDRGWVAGIVTVLMMFSPTYWIARAFNAVTEWLFGFSLFDAGANIVRTIADGIAGMAGLPVEKMKSIVQKIRNLLPFSPAKEGPLKDIHRVKLVETIADSVNPEPLRAAMHRSVTIAAKAVPTAFGTPAALPSFVPLPQPGFTGHADGATKVEAIFNIAGDASPETIRLLDEWIRANGAKIAAIVTRENQLSKRGEFA